MSTTVTYKGSTLTTVENATKKLTTAGTWLEDDITIQDTSSGGGSVVVVDTPDSHGGTIREITAASVVSLHNSSTITPTESAQTILPLSGYSGFRSVTVEAIPSAYIIPSGSLSITENGTYNVEAFATAEVMVSGGGGDSKFDELVMRTISGSVSGNVSVIGSYAFEGCSSLTTVSFSYCSEIGRNAFYSCTSLTSATFPVCTNIGSNAFYGCNKLLSISFPSCITIETNAFFQCYRLCSGSTVSFPVCTTVGTSAFYGCSLMRSLYFPVCTSIGTYAFAYCTSLAYVSFPFCTSIGANAFYGCRIMSAYFPSCTYIGASAFASNSALWSANFPLLQSIPANAFNNCRSINTLSFPVCSLISAQAFASCVNLTTVSFPACGRIASSAFRSCSNIGQAIFGYSCSTTAMPIIYPEAFRYCSKLNSLYLLASTAYTLQNVNVFSDSKLSSSGHIYVQESLYDTYISATNWATYSERFVSLTSEQVQHVIDYGTHVM